MLPITRKRKFKVPNHLAVFAAVLLMVTSLVGLGNTDLPDGKHFVFQAASDVTAQTPLKVPATVPSQSKKNKGFKMSLFLFRNH